MNIVIPEWGVIIGLLGFGLSLAGFSSAIYSRIGRLEGKLNGLKELCDTVKKHGEHIGTLETDVAVLKKGNDG